MERREIEKESLQLKLRESDDKLNREVEGNNSQNLIILWLKIA